MAEMDIYHTQKGEDLKTITVDHLDGEIAFYEQVRKSLAPMIHLELTWTYLLSPKDFDPSESGTFHL